MNSIENYVRAGYPAVCIQSVEEERIISWLAATYDKKQIWTINGVGVLYDVRKREPVDKKAGYIGAFDHLQAAKHTTILVVLDMQRVIHNAYRPLKNVLPYAKSYGHLVVLIGPSWQLPEEISHEIPQARWDLPSRQQLSEALAVCEESVKKTAPNREEILDAGAGLTLSEAEGAFALAWNRSEKRFEREQVESVKMGLIRQSGALALEKPRPISDVGGLKQLRRYLTDEVLPAINDREVMVNGILLVGVPGTGKSLCARATGSVLQWPVIRLNLSAVKGSLVGQSEAQLRQALACIDAVSPAVLWLDELEKAVGGYASSANTDSGVTLSIVGELLTWMQEHTSKVMMVATCNDHLKLPAEMTRSGRFDSLWFVDLPTLSERTEIATVHVSKYKLQREMIPAIAQASEGWTGAEIEGCVRSIARRSRSGIDVVDALAQSIAQVVPLSRSRATEIERLRDWGKDCCLQANEPEAKEEEKKGRLLE